MYLAYNNLIISEKGRMVLAKICHYFWRYVFRNVHKKDKRVETSLPVCFSPEGYLDKFWTHQVPTCHLESICCLGRFEITFKRPWFEHLKYFPPSKSQLQKFAFTPFSCPLVSHHTSNGPWLYEKLLNFWITLKHMSPRLEITPLFRKVDAIVSKWSFFTERTECKG